MIPITDCVAIVVDPSSDRFGQTAEISSHDWKESGLVHVRFCDGTHAEFYDGKIYGDPPPQVLILKRSEFDRPRTHLLQGKLLILRKEFARLNEVARRDDATPGARELAGQDFRTLLKEVCG